MIDPDLWTDEKIAGLSLGAHLLWIAAISLADDEGRLEWSARQLQIRVFPVKDGVNKNDIQAWMDEVARVGAISTYESGGIAYAYHRRWKKHQSIARPTPSKIPCPPGTQTQVESTTLQLESDDSHLYLNADQVVNNESQVPVEEKRREEKRSKENLADRRIRRSATTDTLSDCWQWDAVSGETSVPALNVVPPRRYPGFVVISFEDNTYWRYDGPDRPVGWADTLPRGGTILPKPLAIVDGAAVAR